MIARVVHACSATRCRAVGCLGLGGSCISDQVRCGLSNQNSQVASDAAPSGSAPTSQGDVQPAQGEQPVSLEELRQVPGWLKGPVGRRVVKALGEDEWQEAVHPKTGQECWKNIKTGVLTVPGMPKPDTWTEVVDKRTGLLYYWNRRTGDTTDIGEPKPGPEGRIKKTSFTPEPNVLTSTAASETVQPAEQGRKAAATKRGPPEKEINLFELINTPSGWGFVGFTLLAITAPYIQKWYEGPQVGL